MTVQQLNERILDLSALFQDSRDREERAEVLAEMRAAAEHLQSMGGRLPWN